jgi:hypothetical protein
MFQPSRILLLIALIPGILVAIAPSKFWTGASASGAATPLQTLVASAR